MTTEAESTQSNQWFREENGERKGPYSETTMVELIKASRLTHGTAVWRKSFPDWLKVEHTELAVHFLDASPPPLGGEHVNNTVVWVLAFAPLIGLMLEYAVATMLTSNEFVAQMQVKANKFWFITVGLNIGLGYWDEHKLRCAGRNTYPFKGWAWLVPVYLYQRFKHLKQGPTYFIVWIVCFVLTLLD